MTFNELMQSRNGQWENGFAVIQDQGGFYWRIAEGTPEKYVLTSDGRRLTNAPVKLADTLATKVESVKRHKKPVAVPTQVAEPEPFLDADDFD